MAIRLKPPSHTVDRGGVFIPADDDAWDKDLLLADMQAAESKALAEHRDAVEAQYRETQRQRNVEVTDEEIVALRESCALSDDQRQKAWAVLPYFRYVRGDTRMDIDASDWDAEGKPCTLRGRYLTKGTPSKFYIRRLRPSDYHAAEGIDNTGERLLEFCRLGLKGIESPEFKWQADDSKKRVPEEVMQALHDADVSLPLEIGRAVVLFCRKLSKAEAFR